ncbi:MAG: hypothetical protein K2H36_00360 [Clostridia bacterium]|nr:hypothetical protein [Clostridia bacterium]
MSIIQSNTLRVEINETGSTLESFYDLNRGKELLWQGGEDSWTGKDVTIFPFVARLKDEYYKVDGIKYPMPLHGLCVDHSFEIKEISQSKVEHRFVWNEQTLKYYPYKFDLRVIHEVVGEKYVKTMSVTNVGDDTMYFMLGGHPAIALTSKGDCDTSDNYIQFSKFIRPKNYYLNDAGHLITHLGDIDGFDRLYCDKSLMKKYKTLILTDEEFENISVVRGDGIEIAFELNRTPMLAFWSHPDKGEYICVEPWWGIPDAVEAKREIKEKDRINSLGAGKTFEYSFAMEIKR